MTDNFMHTETEVDPQGRPPLRLEELIAPISVTEFMDEYWEKQPLVVHRDEPSYYSSILTLNDMDGIIANSSLHDGDLRLVADGQETSITALLGDELESKVNGIELLYARYRGGATINLSFLHERWPPLAALCRGLATRFSASVHGNVYLTPRDTRGLSPHHDTHDVFVMQLYGTKRWNLFAPQIQLPLWGDLYETPEEGAGEPIQDFTMRPGDLAYLPRGTVHAATANEDASLHLTVGVTPVVWAHVIRNSLEQVLRNHVRFRHALPPGFATDPELRGTVVARLREFLAEVPSDVSPDDAIDEVMHRTNQWRQPVLAGHLLDLESLPSITLDTRVRLRPQLLWRLTKDDELHLEFHGKTIDLPDYLEEEIAYVAGAPSFTGADIPGGLDDQGRLVLVRQLVQEGFLTMS